MFLESERPRKEGHQHKHSNDRTIVSGQTAITKVLWTPWMTWAKKLQYDALQRELKELHSIFWVMFTPSGGVGGSYWDRRLLRIKPGNGRSAPRYQHTIFLYSSGETADTLEKYPPTKVSGRPSPPMVVPMQMDGWTITAYHIWILLSVLSSQPNETNTPTMRMWLSSSLILRNTGMSFH